MAVNLEFLGLGKPVSIEFNGSMWCAYFKSIPSERYKHIFPNMFQAIGDRVADSADKPKMVLFDVRPVIEQDKSVYPLVLHGEYECLRRYKNIYVLKRQRRNGINCLPFGFHMTLPRGCNVHRGVVFDIVDSDLLTELGFPDYLRACEENRQLCDKKFGNAVDVFGPVIPKKYEDSLSVFYDYVQLWVETRTMITRFKQKAKPHPLAPYTLIFEDRSRNKLTSYIMDLSRELDDSEVPNILRKYHKQATDYLKKFRPGYRKN